MQNSIESINPVFMDADLIDWLGHAHFFCLQSLKTLPPTSHLSGNHHPVQFSFLPSYLTFSYFLLAASYYLSSLVL